VKLKTVLVLATAMVVVAGVLLVPAMLLGGSLKARIVAPLEKALAGTVTIDGKVSFAVLPSPSVTANGLSLRASGLSGTVPKLLVEVRLVPLLEGRLDIAAVRLFSPQLTLASVSAAALAPAAATLPPAGVAPTEPNSSSRGRLDSLSVENGVVTIERGAGVPLRIEALTATAAMPDPAGPMHFSASGRIGQQGFALDGETPLWAGDAGGPLTLQLQLDQEAGSFRLSGQLAGSGEARRFTGKLSARLADSQRLVGLLGRDGGVLADLPGAPLAIETGIAATPQAIEASALAVTYGGMEAHGAATLALGETPRLDLTLAAPRLDLDGFVARSNPAAAGKPAPMAVPVGGTAPAVARPTVPPVWLPSGLAASINLSADIVSWRGALLRSGKVIVAVNDGEIALDEASIVLPGDSAVTVVGQTSTKEGRPHFDGNIDFTTVDLRGLATWLGWDAHAVPADRLHTGRLHGRIEADAGAVALREATAIVDSTKAELGLTLTFGERPAMAMTFAADTINLDAYRRRPAAPAATAAAAATTTAAVASPLAASPLLPAGYDGDVGGRVGQFIVGGITVRNLAFGATWRDTGADAVAFDGHAEAEGLTTRLSGTLDRAGLAANPIHWEASDGDFVQLVRLVAPARASAAPAGAFSFAATLNGNAGDLRVTDLHAAVGPLSATGQVALSLAEDRPKFDATLAFGEIAVASPSSGGRKPVAIAGQAEPATLPASVQPVPWSNDPIDLSWLSDADGAVKLAAAGLTIGATRLDKPVASLSLAGGTLKVDSLAATLFGGALSGSASLSAADHAASAQVSLVHGQMQSALLGLAGLDVADGTMDGDATFATSGRSESEMISRLAGSGRFSIHDGHVKGFDLKAVDDRFRRNEGVTSALLSLLQAGVGGGRTSFSVFGGSFHGASGVFVNDDLRLVADGGGAQGVERIDLPAGTIDARIGFQLNDAPDAPPLVVRLQGPLDSPRKFLDINAIQEWLAERAPVKGGKPKDVIRKLLKGGAP
jgi:uncharacterized protein involved in outer membrane biogenesis